MSIKNDYRLLEVHTSQTPTGTISNCSAQPINGNLGGKTCQRLILDRLPKPAYRLAVVGNGCLQRFHCASGKSYPFTVEVDGEQATLRLSQKSLMSRLKVTPRLIEIASKKDDLNALLRFVDFQESEKLRESGRFFESRKTIYFSRKEFQIGESLIIGPDITVLKIKALVGKGSEARVKKAELLPSRKTVARRITIVTDNNREKIDRSLEIMKRFSNKAGIVQLLGSFRYINSNGKEKWVTLHPLYQCDLFSLLFDQQMSLSDSDKFSFTNQLFTALLSLEGGAHGDLKPENILYDARMGLALTDLNFYQSKDQKRNHNAGTPIWSAPEVLSRKQTFVNKVDVWALGIILFYLFIYPEQDFFSWQTAAQKKLPSDFALRGEIESKLGKYTLPNGIKDLLSRMIEPDVYKRYTIEEANQIFQKLFKKP